MYLRIALLAILSVNYVSASGGLIDETLKKISRNLFTPLCKYDVFDNKNLIVHNSFSLYKDIVPDDKLPQNSIDKILGSNLPMPPKRKAKEFDQVDDIIRYD